ncbi:TPR repeat-containing protein [Novosphingobium nitrogenifigens DSM 19370]|uniref:protein O-GlcNAc transferase n=1 Tax=Novosphingobium nitrogenifigens DSM 19370 TaxID=983920 RepID=F1Z563_9SPHN|nr:tetratricopeptide repeat protein [Novosphingobium nitrogenifigens]EGD60028.1 TPR repeat-containing protein [Novosphingobium nitrogenifigens DSM 19370]
MTGKTTTSASPSRDQIEAILTLARQGRMGDALPRAQALLAAHPSAFDAAHLVGVLQATSGAFAQAETAFRRAADLRPADAEIHFMLGVTLQQQGKADEAAAAFRRASSLNPQHELALLALGTTLQEIGRTGEALDALERLIRLNPASLDAHNNLGVALIQAGQPDKAAAALETALHLRPDAPDTLYNLVAALLSARRFDAALVRSEQLLRMVPRDPQALMQHALVLVEAGRGDEALAHLDAMLAQLPQGAAGAPLRAAILGHRAIALMALGRPEQALDVYDEALRAAPADADIHANRALALLALRRPYDALVSAQMAARHNSAAPQAHNVLGLAHLRLGEYGAAATAFGQGLALRPDDPDMLSHLATALAELERHDEADRLWARALTLAPNHDGALFVQGASLGSRDRHAEAARLFERALALRPERTAVRVEWIHALSHLCDWRAGEEFARLTTEEAEAAGEPVPFHALITLEDDPARLRRRAERYAQTHYGHIVPVAFPPASAIPEGRLKIGYFSADFHDHATMFLMSGLFREHDREQFEIHCYSFGTVREGALREALIGQVDRFHEVGNRTESEIAALAREHGIAVAVDLKGLTGFARFGLFAHRAAPVQIGYLGFPATTGASFIDYILADPVIIPEEERAHYTEQVIRLPHSYQANDNRRPIATDAGSRADWGLPEGAFVFCCFNKGYKIARDDFAGWMRILAAVENSVLWLISLSPETEQALRKAAADAGVDPARLIFAPRAPHDVHLARHAHADLGLDTLRYNAHTTASDALWAGLPVVTRAGRCFAARVGASLNHAVGLSDLVTHDAAGFESLAIALARDPERLAAVRARLADRDKTPLFDTAGFTRAIEAAYRAAWQRHADGLPPADIAIPAFQR